MFGKDQNRIISDYVIQKRIGLGSFGFVYKAVHQSSQ
jgi:serine/threonine protein kinase